MSLKIRMAEPFMRGNEEKYVLEALRGNSLSMGRWVSLFENAVEEMAGAKFAVAVSSGTAALHVALLALGVKPGDRVVVPATTYIATANAVRYCGALPVFADVRADTWTMDPDKALEAAHRHGAVGVITVDLYGVECELPKADGLWTLEDLCEAHGHRLRGEAAVYSFYGNKVATCGEGGAAAVDSPRLAEAMILARGQGTTGARRYVHETLGYNYRLTDLQAAVGRAQLERLGDLLERRAAVRRAYDAMLPPMLGRQEAPPGSVDWAIPITVPDRAKAAAALAERGVETRPVFPPLHWQPLYDRPQKLPVAEALGTYGLLLPLHPSMTERDVEYVCDALRAGL